MSIYEGIGTTPESLDKRYMPFPTVADSEVVEELPEVNSPQAAAMLVANGVMPGNRGIVGLSDGLAGYDFVASAEVNDRECILPPNHVGAVKKDGVIQHTGMIIYSTEERTKLFGAVVHESKASIAAKYGRIIRLDDGLVQVVFRFGLFPVYDIKSKAEGELHVAAPRPIYNFDAN